MKMTDKEVKLVGTTGDKIITMLEQDQVPALLAMECLQRILNEMYRVYGPRSKPVQQTFNHRH